MIFTIWKYMKYALIVLILKELSWLKYVTF